MFEHQFRGLSLPAILVACALLPACDAGLPAGAEPHREGNFLDMGDQPKLKPQRGDLLGEEPNGMRLPPVGALAVDEAVYPYAQDQGDRAGEALENPLERTSQVIEHGQFVWKNVCITCHGPEAAGDGHITKLFPKPPSLMTQKVRDWSDGRIYHLPMRGQGSMPKQTSVVSPQDIWSVIHYIRTMQERLPVAPPAASASGSTPGSQGGDGR